MAFRIKKYSATPIEKENIKAMLQNLISRREELDFAYIHGSFVIEDSFGDIDIAVYSREALPTPPVMYEIDLEIELEKNIKYPLDVKLLNYAPLSFKYNVIKAGTLLFEKDEESRVEFHAGTLSRYLDFAPIRRSYLKEALNIEI